MVSDDQSCAPGSAAWPRRFFEFIDAASAWPLCTVLQHTLGSDPSLMAEPLLQLHFGNRASMGSNRVRRAEPDPRRHRRWRPSTPGPAPLLILRTRTPLDYSTWSGGTAQRKAQERYRPRNPESDRMAPKARTQYQNELRHCKIVAGDRVQKRTETPRFSVISKIAGYRTLRRFSKGAG